MWKLGEGPESSYCHGNPSREKEILHKLFTGSRLASDRHSKGLKDVRSGSGIRFRVIWTAGTDW